MTLKIFMSRERYFAHKEIYFALDFDEQCFDPSSTVARMMKLFDCRLYFKYLKITI